jgi:hypothetical protein
MSTYDDTTILPRYDNLSDLFFIKKPFLVLGVDLKRKRGGRTKKRINNKKNSYKQKQRKKSRKQKRYTNRITL